MSDIHFRVSAQTTGPFISDGLVVYSDWTVGAFTLQAIKQKWAASGQW